MIYLVDYGKVDRINNKKELLEIVDFWGEKISSKMTIDEIMKKWGVERISRKEAFQLINSGQCKCNWAEV